MKKTFLLSLVTLSVLTTWAQTVEFYTPRTVRIVNDNGQKAGKKSLVVIAQPEQVKVSLTQKGNATVYKSSALTAPKPAKAFLLPSPQDLTQVHSA